VAVWDDEQDRIAREALSRGVVAMRKRHADIAMAMEAKALRALQKIPPEDMSPRDISTMVDVASKIERLSRGEVTEKTENKTEIDGGQIHVYVPDCGRDRADDEI
jgi:hypothetical protein